MKSLQHPLRCAAFAVAGPLPAILLFAVTLFAVRPLAAQTTPSSPLQQLEARARALDAQGRHDLAADNWRQVLLIDPKQPDALSALAAYSQSVGDRAHASQYLQQLRASGGSAGMANNQTAAAPAGGDPRLQQAAKLAAGHRYPEALALYRQVFGTTPPAGPWAIAYYETAAAVPDQLAAATAGLRGLIVKYPQDPTYQLSLGKVLTYRPATRLEGVHILAGLRGSAQQNEQARVAWRQAMLWEPTGPAAVQTGGEYLQRFPDPDLAARLKSEEARASVRPEAPLESPLEGEGYKALSSGDLVTAKERFSALLALPGSAGRAHAGLGYVAEQQQDFAAAADNFTQARIHGLQTPAIEKALNESRYFQAMGDGNKALKLKDFDAAVAAFTRARQIDAQRPEAIQALGGALVAAGQPGKAQALFAEAVKRDPDDLDAWVEWFDALLGAGDAQRVLEEQAKIPSSTSHKLEQRVDYLAILSSANKLLGDDAAAQRMIGRVEEAAARGGAQSAAAQLRAAGLLLQQADPEGAAQLARAVVQADHGNVEAWEMLVRAAHTAADDVSAMSVAERMPEPVYKTALKDPEFLMTLASIDQAREQYEQAAKLLDRARSTGPEELAGSPRFQLQLASLDLASGNPEHAYNTYRKVAAEYPEQIQAWSGMLAALHAGKHDQEALLSVQKLPADIALRLQADPAFLQSLASVYSDAGHPHQAVECLRLVASIYQQRAQPVPFSVDTQFAWLLLNQGDQRQLAVTLDRLGNHRNLAASQKLELENLWAAWSMRRAEADYALGNGRQALTILQVANQAYPDHTALRRELCSMYVRTGNPGPALKIYEDLNWETAKVGDYSSAVDAAIVAHRPAMADKWLQSGLERFPGNDQLLALGARLEEQRGDIRKAREYLLAEIDNSQNAASGLNSSSTLAPPGFPSLDDDGQPDLTVAPAKVLSEILGAASGTPLRPGKSAPARSTGALAGSPVRKLRNTAPALPSSSSSALTAFDLPLPHAADQPATRQESSPAGSLRPAIFGSSELPAWPAKMSFPRSLPPPSPGDPDYAAAQLSGATAALAATRLAGERVQPLAHLRQISFPVNDFRNTGEAAADTVQQSAPDSTQVDPTGGDPTGGDPTGGDPVRNFTTATPLPASEASMASEQQASDQLAALESRYSPYSGGGGYVDSHTGTQGFDRLQRFEAGIEASSVMGDSLRLTVITRPVLLESGVPDASSNYRFGTGTNRTGASAQINTGVIGTQLPTADQFAAGYGGELQVAGKFIQGSIGYSPVNFPVAHVLGSLAVQPGNFPISVRVYREPVTDTLLSYAGVVDPYTGKTWGGVVATGGALKLAYGSGLSGLYASVDGQELTGRNIAGNTRIAGGAGAYFHVFGDRYGVFKVGANLTVMHYDRNERYFTFGQGGYFSPSSFLLMNAPLTWEGTPLHNFTYFINGSLGLQAFQDDAAQPGSLIVGTGAQSVTGASYDFHTRVAYRLNPHWTIEAFIDANNSRDYQNTAGGFSVRYMIRPLPPEGGPSGLIEDRQLRPLAIP